MSDYKIHIAILGGTGAVGREIVRYSQKLNNVHLTIFCRRVLPEWHTFKNITLQNIEDLKQINQFSELLKNHKIFLCTLGSRIKNTDFEDVDKNIPILFAKLAQDLKVSHYGICSSAGANKSSIFKYMRVKGECEDLIQKIELKSLVIYKPGFLKNRENDFRFGELFGFLACVNVETKVVAKVMVDRALQVINQDIQGVEFFSNNDIKLFESKKQK